MVTLTQTAAFVGVALAGAAYVPQIWHLVRAHCAAGISRFAFRLWLVGSLLVTSHAISTRAWVFVALGVVQILATTLILWYATKYATSDCGGHGTRRMEPETKAGAGATGAFRLVPAVRSPRDSEGSSPSVGSNFSQVSLETGRGPRAGGGHFTSCLNREVL